MGALPVAGRVYVLLVATAALAVLVPLLWVDFEWSTLIILAVLSVFIQAISNFSVAGFSNATVSLGFPVGLAAVILLPPSAAALVAVAGGIAVRFGKLPWLKVLFNTSQLALAAGTSRASYELVGGPPELSVNSFPAVLLPVLAAAATYCLVNGLLLAGVLYTAEDVPLASVWRSTFSRSIASYLGYGLIGLMMALLWQSRLGAFAALLVLLPLSVARWTFAQYAEQQAAYDATVRALVQAVETKDFYTRGHSERVSKASVLIAQHLGMREDRIASLRYAGILHDIGKLGVPTRLLQKSGPLTQAEYEAIQLHPVRGLEMVREIEFLGEAYAGIMHHHERLDGRGYPMGLAGEAIPEFARVIAVADAFDSMTSTRSYRAARSVEEALEEIRRCSGVHFDPAMVRALLQAVAEHGWEPADVPAPRPSDTGAEVARYDHDDPEITLPVVQPDPR
jgi:hypothetical protein